MPDYIFSKEEVDMLVARISNYVNNKISANDHFKFMVGRANSIEKQDEALEDYEERMKRNNEILAEFLRSLTRR